MKFRFEHRVAAPADVLFRFHENPANLGRLLERWPGFRILHHDGTIRPGSTTWVEQTIAGCVPVVLGFRHTVFEPPARFGEELIHGPFRRFSHVHEFEPAGDGTIVRDRLDIELPWQYGGACATRIVVGPALRRFFEFRHRALDELSDSGLLTRPD